MSRTLHEEVAFDTEKVTSVDWISHPTLTHADAPAQIDVVLVNGDPNPNRPDLPHYGAGETAMQADARRGRQRDLRCDRRSPPPRSVPGRARARRAQGRGSGFGVSFAPRQRKDKERRMAKPSSVDRRDFLKSAAVTGAALVAGAIAADAQAPHAARQPAGGRTAPVRAERSGSVAGDGRRPDDRSARRRLHGGRHQVAGLRVRRANPGSSFRGLHESIINYGGNKTPEFITCCHEESSVAMAHGYAKIEGKPLAVLAHGTVGLQHASMAIYNAYCDRVPVYIIVGNTLDATMRRPGVEWAHSVQDAAAMVRDFTKWDDTADVAAALRRIRRARLQDRDDAADDAGRCSSPTADCRRIRFAEARRGCASRS